MKPSQCKQLCPECGAAMKAGQPVTSCGQQGRWWKCSNARCGTSLLIPGRTIEARAILAQISQSSLHNWLQNGP